MRWRAARQSEQMPVMISRWPVTRNWCSRATASRRRMKLIAGEFDQLVALGAVQMIVLRVAVIVFVNGAAAEDHFSQQAGFDHFGQRAVDGRPANFAGRGGAA